MYSRSVTRYSRYKRKPSSRGRYRQRPITYGQIGKKIYRDVRWLKSVINVEKKYIDTTLTNQASAVTGTLTLINGVGLGDTGQTRDGQSIKIVSIEIRGQVEINSSANASDFKWAVLFDSQANGSTPLVSNIWSSGSPTALRLIGTGTRFQVIHSKNMALSKNGNEMLCFKWFKKLSVHTKYNTGNAGDITDIVTNALYFFNSSNETTNFPTINVSIRVRFIDN